NGTPRVPPPTNGNGKVSLGELSTRVLPEGPPPAALSSSPTPQALWQAFRRRWFVALSAGVVLGAIAAVVMWQLTPPLSRARTKLFVLGTRPYIAFPDADGKSDPSSFPRSQIALIKSRWILGRVLKEENVAKLPLLRDQAEPEEWLEKNLEVSFSDSP